MTAKWRGFLDKDLELIHEALSICWGEEGAPEDWDRERVDTLTREIEEEAAKRTEDEWPDGSGPMGF